MEDATTTTEQGKKRIEESDNRVDKYFEMLGEKVAEVERARSGRRSRIAKAKMQRHKVRQEIAKASQHQAVRR